MSLPGIAAHYVDAFSRSLAENKRASVLSELSILGAALAQHIQTIQKILHPGISGSDKAVLLKSWAIKVGASDKTCRFFEVLGQRNQVALIPFLESATTHQLNTINNNMPAEFVFATAVSDGIKTELVNQFQHITKKTVVPSFKVNPEILGGFQVFFENKVLDGSLFKTMSALATKMEVA